MICIHNRQIFSKYDTLFPLFACSRSSVDRTLQLFQDFSSVKTDHAYLTASDLSQDSLDVTQPITLRSLNGCSHCFNCTDSATLRIMPPNKRHKSNMNAQAPATSFKRSSDILRVVCFPRQYLPLQGAPSALIESSRSGC